MRRIVRRSLPNELPHGKKLWRLYGVRIDMARASGV
ncbi:unnamed protein product [Chondrus crispus]|uniref:Uncharacterized protein n=1 Tax=Chondrus crispus TaxID=2769 RepID=R7Q5B5_CHOCR|nr:unnamed protein product [Chondrus crispus]CDF33219.1 unnamed protein product [Chondrus crispus]|eukprot:XP_005713023.1 unnamed protein product [Chondrus crispus]